MRINFDRSRGISTSSNSTVHFFVNYVTSKSNFNKFNYAVITVIWIWRMEQSNPNSGLIQVESLNQRTEKKSR